MKTRVRQLFVALAAAAASSASTSTEAAETPHPYPVPDAFLGERLYPNEEGLAQRLSLVIDDTIRRKYRPGTARRDAHPKGHGCVRAEFRVDENLDPRFAKGVFIPGKAYQAWVRQGDQWTSLGTFMPDADGAARVIAENSALAGSPNAVEITVESAGGSQTPSDTVVLRWLPT